MVVLAKVLNLVPCEICIDIDEDSTFAIVVRSNYCTRQEIGFTSYAEALERSMALVEAMPPAGEAGSPPARP